MKTKSDLEGTVERLVRGGLLIKEGNALIVTAAGERFCDGVSGKLEDEELVMLFIEFRLLDGRGESIGGNDGNGGAIRFS